MDFPKAFRKESGTMTVLMAAAESTENLYDPQRGDAPLRLQKFRLPAEPLEPARTNLFTIYFIERGRGKFFADSACHAFHTNELLFFVPYQYIRLEPAVPVVGKLLQFHANFLCVETFHQEVGCSGILFNDPYGVPTVHLDVPAQAELRYLLKRIEEEQSQEALAGEELRLAYMKVLLILATRQKQPHATVGNTTMADVRHPTIAELITLIEKHYCKLHAPADYAKLLHMTPKTLGRLVREQLGKTLGDLIRDRILMHAKWQLLHTLRPVKEIAREVGFADELYFSRLFKKGTGYSPTFFREFETEIRGGSNLSMVSSSSSILH